MERGRSRKPAMELIGAVEAQVPQHCFRPRRREVRAREPASLEGGGDFGSCARVEEPEIFAHLLQELVR